jgi:fructose-bisphosphate aldolase, class II
MSMRIDYVNNLYLSAPGGVQIGEVKGAKAEEKKGLNPQEAKAKLDKVKSYYQHAMNNNYALGAFNFNELISLQGLVNAVNKANAPCIIQISQGARKFAGEDPLIGMFDAFRKQIKAPVMLHLDHGTDVKTCNHCVDQGFDSVMIDASKHDFATNVKMSKEVVEYAHARGVFVEAELGKIQGQEDNVISKEQLYTDPDEAAEFVSQTGCDALAVSVGTKHGNVKFSEDETPALDFDRIKLIREKIETRLRSEGKLGANENYPLVLHGASSVPADLVERVNKYVLVPRVLFNQMLKDEGVKQEYRDELKKYDKSVKGKGVSEDLYNKAVKEYKMAKVNVDTDFRMAYTAAIREYMINNYAKYTPRDYLGPARDATTEIALRKLDMLNATGKAAGLSATA